MKHCLTKYSVKTYNLILLSDYFNKINAAFSIGTAYIAVPGIGIGSDSACTIAAVLFVIASMIGTDTVAGLLITIGMLS